MLKAFTYIICCIYICVFFASSQNKKIYIYNWSDYISKKVIKEFEKKTDISITYDVFDTEAVLDAKLMSGNIGYDIVFPSNGQFLRNQINMGLYQKIDKKQLKNYKYLDPNILKLLEELDPGNKYTVPFMWTTTGIGYNPDLIKKIDPKVPIDSLELVFNPQYAKKFSKCGIAWFNSPSEIIGMAILYNGGDPNYLSDENLELAKQTLKKVYKYVKYMSNDSYINDLIEGEICLAIGWTGDIAQRSKESELMTNQITVKYYLPKEGFFLSVDTMAIPVTSGNSKDSYKFIDFLLTPKIAARNANFTKHMLSNIKAIKLLDKAMRNDPNINLLQDVFARAYVNKDQPNKILRKRNRIWNDILIDEE